MNDVDRRGGWFRLWRSFFSSAIWTSAPHAWARVALVILAKANWKPGTLYDGTEVPAGSLVTSRENLAKEARATLQQTRDALAFLERANFSTYKGTKRYTIVTVTNWKAEQTDGDDEEPTKEPTKEPTETRPGPVTELLENPNLRSQSGNQGIKEAVCGELDPCLASASAGSTLSRTPSIPDSKVDLDYLGRLPKGEPFPHLRELVEKTLRAAGKERMPAARTLVEIVAQAPNMSEGEIVEALALRVRHVWGTKNHPQTSSWFKSTLHNYVTNDGLYPPAARTDPSDGYPPLAEEEYPF